MNLKGELGVKKREHSKANNKLRTQYTQKMSQEPTYEASKSLISRHFELSVVLLGFEGLQSGLRVALRLYKSSSRQLLPMTCEMKSNGSQKTLEEIIALNSHIDITAAMTRL